VRYWIASLRCFGSMQVPPSRSAMLRATFRMRSWARAERQKQGRIGLPFIIRLIGTQAHCRNGHVGGTARISMPLMLRHPHHQAAACMDATAHSRRGHHRTTSDMSCSVRSRDRCRPHSQGRRPDTTAPGPSFRLPFLPSTRNTSCRHSTRVGRFAVKVKALLRLKARYLQSGTAHRVHR
jgi:hypothetical protein